MPDFRFNEIKTFVGNGLQDFSISRLKSKCHGGQKCQMIKIM